MSAIAIMFDMSSLSRNRGSSIFGSESGHGGENRCWYRPCPYMALLRAWTAFSLGYYVSATGLSARSTACLWLYASGLNDKRGDFRMRQRLHIDGIRVNSELQWNCPLAIPRAQQTVVIVRVISVVSCSAALCLVRLGYGFDILHTDERILKSSSS